MIIFHDVRVLLLWYSYVWRNMEPGRVFVRCVRREKQNRLKRPLRSAVCALSVRRQASDTPDPRLYFLHRPYAPRPTATLLTRIYPRDTARAREAVHDCSSQHQTTPTRTHIIYIAVHILPVQTPRDSPRPQAPTPQGHVPWHLWTSALCAYEFILELRNFKASAGVTKADLTKPR